ncbi:MAG: hypothetical protein J0L83_14550 [Chitinophagales bacterium]|nr:hypothetical protein [Chitinophagales bacterium]
MKAIPILFSTPMVQAILDGRKTQTRRVVKPQPLTHGRTDSRVRIYQRGEKWEVADTFSNDGFSCLDSFKCPYGQPGDVLWVRESFNRIEYRGSIEYVYKAEPSIDPCKNKFSSYDPSIHMPKAACRLFLQVKSVRVERLQDISEDDAIAEGIGTTNGIPVGMTSHYIDYLDEKNCYSSSINSFKSLWQSIKGPESWDANPWVWVVEFERIEKPAGWPF